MKHSFLQVLLDGFSIEYEGLSLSTVYSRVFSHSIDDLYYQVVFYDKYKDFEISKVFECPEQAVNFFLELRDVISYQTPNGQRKRTIPKIYDQIYSYEPSVYRNKKKTTRKKI